MRKVIRISALLALLLFPALRAFPQTYIWTGAAGNPSWSDAGNWLVGGAPPALPPGGGAEVIIANPAVDPVIMDAASPVAILSLAIDAGSSLVLSNDNLSITGNCALGAAGSGSLVTNDNGLVIQGSLSLENGGTFDLSGAAAGTIFDVRGDIGTTTTGSIIGGNNGAIQCRRNVNLTGISLTPGRLRWQFLGTTNLTSGGNTLSSIRIGNNGGTAGNLTATSALTLSGNDPVYGAVSVGSAGGNLSTGANTITVTTGAVNLANLTSLTVGGTFVFAGTTTLTMPAGPAFALQNIQIGGTGGTADALLTLGSSLYLGGDITIGATSGDTTLTITDRNLNGAGDVDLSGLDTFDVGNSTVDFTGAAADQNLDPGGMSFNNLTKSGGNGRQLVLQSPLTVDATLRIAGNNVVNMGAFDFSVQTLDNEGVLALTGTQAAQDITTMDSASGMVRYYDGTGDGAVRLDDFFNLRIDGAGRTFTLDADKTVNGFVDVNAGTLSDGGYTIDVYGNWTAAAGARFLSAGTVAFRGNNAQILGSGGADADHAFYTLTVNRDPANAVSLDTYGIRVNGTLRLEAGTFSQNGLTVTMYGSWSKTGGTYTHGDGLVRFLNTEAVTLRSGGMGPGGRFYDLTIDGSRSVALSTDGLFVAGALTIGPAAGAALRCEGLDIAVTGAFSNTGTLALRGNEAVSLTMDTDSGTVAYYGNIAYGGLAAGNAYFDLTLDNEMGGGAGEWAPGGILTVNGSLTVGGTGASELDVADNNATVGGHYTVNASGAVSIGAQTFTFTAAAAAPDPADIRPGGSSFSAFRVNAAGRTVRLRGDTSVNGDVVIAAGTLDADGYAIDVYGSWLAAGGGFTSGAGTVSLEGGSECTITGSTSFYNFLCVPGPGGKTVRFTAGTTQSIANDFTVQGTAKNLVSLVSAMPAGEWTIVRTGTGTVDLDYALVQYGNAGPGSTDIVADASRNDGYNDDALPSPHWVFSRTEVVWEGGGAIGTDWAQGDNWSTGYRPNATDDARIPNTANTATLTDATAVMDLIIETGGRVDTNGRDLTAAEDIVSSGELTGSDDGFINVAGNLDFSAPGVNFIPNRSTIRFQGAADSALENPEESLFNLTVAKTAAADSVRLQNDIEIPGALSITSGTLDAGSISTITLSGGLWSNAGVFDPGTCEVELTNAATRILGSTTFFDFSCEIPGAVISFQNEDGWGYGQVIQGDFRIVGEDPVSSHIRLTSTSAGPVTGPMVDPDQWQIDIQGTAAIRYAVVEKSYAITVVTPEPSCDDGGGNYNWYFLIPILASWTVDTNDNGRIDRIRVKVLEGVQLSDDFDELVAAVQGYAVTGFGTAGGAGDDVFDILLQEGAREDSDARPRWQLPANPGTGLYGIVGGARVAFGPASYPPSDGARPVISYTLAAAGSARVYVHFSEPVYGSAAAAPIGNGIIMDADDPVQSAARLETSGNSSHAAMLALENPLAPEDILLSSAQTLAAAAGRIWGSVAVLDPGAYANTNLDGNLPPNADRSALPTPHNVSDVGLNIVTPVFAYDQTVERDSVRGGIGKLTVFDGTGWLRPRDTLLEARILAASAAGRPLAVHWDVDPVDPILLGNLWIPEASTTLFPAQTGATPPPPPPPPNGSDRYHNANGEARSSDQSAAAGALRDFTIPASDPELRNGATLQFLFTIDEGGGRVLPCAYVADANDPRTAAPWSFMVRELVEERGHVTITNNVINPELGEVANLHYLMPQNGRVTITVFDLKGDVVDILLKGVQSAGEHTTSWNGKNRGGRPVARGIYFIRAVGPGFDEFRKVLVVR